MHFRCSNGGVDVIGSARSLQSHLEREGCLGIERVKRVERVERGLFWKLCDQASALLNGFLKRRHQLGCVKLPFGRMPFSTAAKLCFPCTLFWFGVAVLRLQL